MASIKAQAQAIIRRVKTALDDLEGTVDTQSGEMRADLDELGETVGMLPEEVDLDDEPPAYA